MIVKHERYGGSRSRRIEPCWIREGQQLAAVVDLHREAPEQLEAEHAIDADSFDSGGIDRRGEAELIVQASSTQGELLHSRKTSRRCLLSGAGHCRGTDDLQSQFRNQLRGYQGVPPGVDYERVRPLAIDRGCDINVIVEQAERHRRTGRASVDSGAGRRRHRARVGCERARGAERKPGEAQIFVAGFARAVVDGDFVGEHQAVFTTVAGKQHALVKELLILGDARQQVGVGVEPGAEGFAPLRCDSELVQSLAVDALSPGIGDCCSRVVRPPRQVREPVGLIDGHRYPVAAFLGGVRARGVPHPWSISVKPVSLAHDVCLKHHHEGAGAEVDDIGSCTRQSAARIAVVELGAAARRYLADGRVISRQDSRDGGWGG